MSSGASDKLRNAPRTVRKFSSMEEQDAETERFWRDRSVAERLEAAADLARNAYSIRIVLPTSVAHNPPSPDRSARLMRCIVRKFRSFDEQEAWNLEYVMHQRT